MTVLIIVLLCVAIYGFIGGIVYAVAEHVETSAVSSAWVWGSFWPILLVAGPGFLGVAVVKWVIRRSKVAAEERRRRAHMGERESPNGGKPRTF